ncbi:hypothetical protein JVU11DRAFT_3884 [Chiua virens]|nr:hypothetical protein JVU11DRAFT_3884 [Chiua virens]
MIEIERSAHHLFEYTWETKGAECSSQSNLTEPIISVFFDGHAQQRFSSVRIYIGREVGDNPILAIHIADERKIAPWPLPPSVIKCTSSASLEAEVANSNPFSLPVLELYYLKALEDGALTLEEFSAPQLLLEIEQLLTPDTQNVTAVFRSWLPHSLPSRMTVPP